MRPATTIGVFLLALIAFGHLLRLLFGWTLVIGDRIIPMWPSGVVAVLFGAMSLLVWREARAP